jgi:hypothetical protein
MGEVFFFFLTLMFFNVAWAFQGRDISTRMAC